MNEGFQMNNNSRKLFGSILWIIAVFSFIGLMLFSIGLFQRLPFGEESARLELLLFLLGILNASSISGSIFLASRNE